MRKLSQVEQNNLVSLLIDALNDEWVAFLRYQIHASRIRGLYKDPISEHLESHADDEKDHARRLTLHFYSHGLPVDLDIPGFKPGNEVVEMIQLDLEGEVAAIDRYTKIIELCENVTELKDTQMLIEDLIVSEIEHQDENASFIKAKISERENAMSGVERVSIASTLLRAADAADDIGLSEFANKYTKFASEI